jgi:hypothetical protein
VLEPRLEQAKKGKTSMNQSVAAGLGHHLKRLIFGMGVVAGILSATTVLAVEVPYADNFDSYSAGSMPDNFTTQTTGSGSYYSGWSIDNPSGTAGAYRNTAIGDFMQTSAAVDVTNLAQSDFLLSTTFVVADYGSFSSTFKDINVGLNALASGSTLVSTGYQLSYELLDHDYSTSATGALQIADPGDGIETGPSVTLPVVVGATYTMTLRGSYLPNGLLLTGILSDGSNSVSVTLNDGTPEQGSYFGYHDEASGLFNQGSYVDIDYDNFSVSVPEPRTLWFLGVGIVILCSCRKSRRLIWRWLSRRAEKGQSVILAPFCGTSLWVGPLSLHKWRARVRFAYAEDQRPR